MALFLHSKKNMMMFTKNSLMLACMLFLLITGKSQSVTFKRTNGTSDVYSISGLQNFTYGTNTIIIKPTTGGTVTYNLNDLVSYRYDASTSVNDLNVVNSAELNVYPNPFKSFLNISYELKSAEQITVEILDITGKTIKKWPTERKSAGSHTLTWNTSDANGSSLKPGNYICRISTSFGSISKIIMMDK